jgi:hypothetical protein
MIGIRIEEETMSDLPRIWLEPGSGLDHKIRRWCEEDVWSCDPNCVDDGPPTEYVRADIAERRRKALARIEVILQSDEPPEDANARIGLVVSDGLSDE